jgi:hypothetical protein
MSSFIKSPETIQNNVVAIITMLFLALRSEDSKNGITPLKHNSGGLSKMVDC